MAKKFWPFARAWRKKCREGNSIVPDRAASEASHSISVRILLVMCSDFFQNTPSKTISQLLAIFGGKK